MGRSASESHVDWSDGGTKPSLPSEGESEQPASPLSFQAAPSERRSPLGRGKEFCSRKPPSVEVSNAGKPLDVLNGFSGVLSDKAALKRFAEMSREDQIGRWCATAHLGEIQKIRVSQSNDETISYYF